MKFELTTITPVHIGAGKEKSLSHLSDYFLDEATREACYIDHRTLEKFMREYPEPQKIIDDFVRRVRGEQSQAQHKYGVRAFLEDYGANPAEFVRERVLVNAPEELKAQQIQPTVRNAGRPYIPGSSLKGAIRTALLYYEITQENKGNLKRTIQNIVQLQKQKDHKNAKAEFNRLEQQIFGAYDKDTFRLLHVTDTETLPISTLSIIHGKRMRLSPTAQKGPDIRNVPFNYEAIAPESTARFELKCMGKAGNQSPQLKSYFHTGAEGIILKLINSYSRRFVEEEMQALENKPDLTGVYRFYAKELMPMIENLSEGEAILSLGRGKTYFNNSIGLAFDENELEQVRKLYRLGENRRTRLLVKPFPTTRTVIIENGRAKTGLGWVKISSRNDATAQR